MPGRVATPPAERKTGALICVSPPSRPPSPRCSCCPSPPCRPHAPTHPRVKRCAGARQRRGSTVRSACTATNGPSTGTVPGSTGAAGGHRTSVACSSSPARGAPPGAKACRPTGPPASSSIAPGSCGRVTAGRGGSGALPEAASSCDEAAGSRALRKRSECAALGNTTGPVRGALPSSG